MLRSEILCATQWKRKLRFSGGSGRLGLIAMNLFSFLGLANIYDSIGV